MSKKKNPPPKIPNSDLFPFLTLRKQIIFLLLVVAIFYGNTLVNEYALDDVMVITMNHFTQKGFAGIPDILTKDSFYGFIGSGVTLTGGRWRPLSIVMFAVEQEFFKGNPHVSHFINVALYALTILLLLIFLPTFIFKSRPELAFLTALLFAVHPVHTEVVANIKSRDEIFSLLFLILSLHLIFKYHLQEKKIGYVFLGLLCYFLALLSKENGITFLVIIPLLFYFFSSFDLKKIISLTIPFVLVAFIYLLIRSSVIGDSHQKITEIMNAPFLLASVSEKYATIIFILLKYLKFLIFPHPLSYDYSYNQIPYVNFSNPFVWISVLIHLGLFVFVIWKWRENNIFSFAILFYFITLSIVFNLFVEIGAPMGERFLYQPSLGFSILLAGLILFFYEKFYIMTKQLKKNIVWIFLLAILIFSGAKTITRNRDWKNDYVLFVEDAETCPNSARTNNACGTALIHLSENVSELEKQEILARAIQVLNRSLEIYPKYVDAYLNLGTVYSRLDDLEKAEAMWNEAQKLYPAHPKLKEYDNFLSDAYIKKGWTYGQQKKYQEAIQCFYKSIHFNSNNPESWYNLGGAYYTIQRYDSAKIAFEKTLQLNPSHPYAVQGLKAIGVQ